MDAQNITLSLPKELLLKVKLIAVRRRTSVSRLLSQTLESIVRQEEAFERARRHHLQTMDQTMNLGSAGQITLRREELHDRS